MASVFQRGPRGRRVWYGQWKHADDKHRMEPVPEQHRASRAKALAWAEEEERKVEEGRATDRKLTCAELMPKWLASLINRNARDDRYRCDKHLLPEFKERRPSEIRYTDLVQWLDKLKGAKLSGASQRQCLNLLSRFFGWAIARGYAEINPVRQLPRGERPRQAPKAQDAPWVKDDKVVLAIAGELPSPLGLLYLVGNRCGMRPAEVAGLRLSDLAELEQGRIRVRYSEDGPLKEDKGDGPAPKVKWAPAPPDLAQLLASWLGWRDPRGEKGEEYLFQAPGGGFYTKMQRSRAWRALPAELRGGMTWYEASRHSFASRNLEAGASLDEVSGALGHSTPAVTARHYARFIRKDFGATLRRPLQLVEAVVLPFPAAAKK